MTGPVSLYPLSACVMNPTHDNVTRPLTPCNGFSALGFRCPTATDPLRPENLPPTPGSFTELSLLNVIPPYYAARVNISGTCGTHSFHQYYEALLDRFADDLGPKRVIYVDGLPITVPTPRVATSVASGLWELYAWAGTHAGDPDLDPAAKWPYPGSKDFAGADPSVKGMMPLFLHGYWPARRRLGRMGPLFRQSGAGTVRGPKPYGSAASVSPRDSRCREPIATTHKWWPGVRPHPTYHGRWATPTSTSYRMTSPWMTAMLPFSR